MRRSGLTAASHYSQPWARRARAATAPACADCGDSVQVILQPASELGALPPPASTCERWGGLGWGVERVASAIAPRTAPHPRPLPTASRGEGSGETDPQSCGSNLMRLAP